MTVATSIIPPVQKLLNELQERYAALDEGEVATYIPELGLADPSWFGIAIVALDGHVYTVGDCDQPFTIQSMSKPFVYGLALEDHGWDHVIEHVGLEPTGDAFNAISLDPATGRPPNPMINAGAIATTSLIKDLDGVGAMQRILDMFSRYAGRELHIDESVYRSESETGHRNRAISHLLRNFNIVEEDPERGLDLYFRQCSISVTCRDIAMMAATLANRGVNPVTGERALDSLYADSVLSIMGSCGMYNYAGEWIYRIGMPAKSGVAGGVLACLSGQLGIGVFSPRLDTRGNSVRGVRVCDDLSREYRLHIHNAPNVSRAAIRARYDVVEVRSKRQRRTREADVLQQLRPARARLRAAGPPQLRGRRGLHARHRGAGVRGRLLRDRLQAHPAHGRRRHHPVRGPAGRDARRRQAALAGRLRARLRPRRPRRRNRDEAQPASTWPRTSTPPSSGARTSSSPRSTLRLAPTSVCRCTATSSSPASTRRPSSASWRPRSPRTPRRATS